MLCSCRPHEYHPPGSQPNELEKEQIQNTIIAWQSFSNLAPYNDECQFQFENNLHIVRANESEIRTFCRACGPDMCQGLNAPCSTCVHACQPTHQYKSVVYPLIVIHESHHCKQIWYRLVVHEAIHWLGNCTGNGNDPDHLNMWYWDSTNSVKSETVLLNPPLDGGCL